LIVVDDASTDRTSEILAQFSDPRLRVVVHSQNRGLSAARNSGIRASSGDLLAFLDGDDFFEKHKIASHVRFLQTHPDVGVTYNARFELNHSGSTIRGLWRAPATCGLDQFVMGFPFAPSDMVVRRDWLWRVGLFDESLLYYSEDLDINCRLALAGCRFACVDEALNYRRYHSGRVLRVRERLAAALEVLDRVLDDSRCPAEVVASRDAARAAHYMVWSFYAFSQDDTACGREFLRNAIRLDPSHSRIGILRSLLLHCVADGSSDHRSELRRILDQFPPELSLLGDGWSETAAQGYLVRAITAAIWERTEEAEELVAQAVDARAQTNAWLVGLLVTHLVNVEELLGAEVARAALGRVEQVAQKRFASTVRELKASYFLNRGFQSYEKARYCDAIRSAGQAVLSNCRYAGNRGLLSIAVRSAWSMLPFPLRGYHAVIE
jgi:tetratricopeptide (TPR) repeat protein